MVSRMQISKLSPHPLQDEYYANLSAAEFQALTEDIAANGQRQAVEITKQSVIIDGHQRIKVLRHLGQQEVDVIIRDADETKAEELFLSANANRRQLGPLERIRVILRLVQIDREQKGYLGPVQITKKLQDKIIGTLGDNVSPRTVRRYLQLLRLPREIQDAVSEGHLPLTQALKLDGMRSSVREAVIDQIAAGEPAKQVVAEALETLSDESLDEQLDAGEEGVEDWFVYLVSEFANRCELFEDEIAVLAELVEDESVIAAIEAVLRKIRRRVSSRRK